MSASPQPWNQPRRRNAWSRPLRGLLIASAAAALVACGSDDDSTPSVQATTLGGVAAVGKPILGAAVKVSCAGGAALSTTTAAGGAWEVTISGQTLPCAVQVSGGTVNGAANVQTLHSLALAFGTVNITPLTELVVARAVAGSPQAWFAAPAFAGVTAANLNAAVTRIVTALGISATLEELNPLVSPFQAQSGDAVDDVLEALSAALQALGTDFGALLVAAGANDFAAFAGLPNAIAAAKAGGGGSSGGSCSAGVEMSFARGQAAGPFTDGQKVCVDASSTSLKIAGLTLGNPTTNAIVTAPFSAYTFVDAGLN